MFPPKTPVKKSPPATPFKTGSPATPVTPAPGPPTYRINLLRPYWTLLSPSLRPGLTPTIFTTISDVNTTALTLLTRYTSTHEYEFDVNGLLVGTGTGLGNVLKLGDLARQEGFEILREVVVEVRECDGKGRLVRDERDRRREEVRRLVQEVQRGLEEERMEKMGLDPSVEASPAVQRIKGRRVISGPDPRIMRNVQANEGDVRN